jgi:hypothetical protein
VPQDLPRTGLDTSLAAAGLLLLLCVAAGHRRFRRLSA